MKNCNLIKNHKISNILKKLPPSLIAILGTITQMVRMDQEKKIVKSQLRQSPLFTPFRR